jgi:hypothetical protein
MSETLRFLRFAKPQIKWKCERKYFSKPVIEFRVHVKGCSDMDTEEFCHLYRESEMKLQVKLICTIINNLTERKIS